MALGCIARVESRGTPLRAVIHTFRDESSGEIVATTHADGAIRIWKIRR